MSLVEARSLRATCSECISDFYRHLFLSKKKHNQCFQENPNQETLAEITKRLNSLAISQIFA